MYNAVIVVVMRLGQYHVANAATGIQVVTFNQIVAPLADDKVAAQINMGIVISISELRMALGLIILRDGTVLKKLLPPNHKPKSPTVL